MIAGKGRPTERLRAEVSLVDCTLLGTRKGHPPVVEFAQPVWHLFRHRLDFLGIVEEMAFIQRVGGVNRPRVLGVVGPQRAVDTAAGPRRVCVAVAALAQHEHVLDALLCEFDCCPRTGRARTDHEDRHVDALVGRNRRLLVSGEILRHMSL
jgi:hypothetical protein